MADSKALPAVGEVVANRYRIDRLLGMGGMGAVFAASHVVTGKRVALKWLLPQAAKTPDAAERFLREAKAAARITHPNIVDIYDVGTDGESQFLVMELLTGEALNDRLARKRIDASELTDIMGPTLRGLAAAHRAGVIHRDLKPDNIFLCEDPDGGKPRPRVLDFGISKLSTDTVSALTQTGMIMGTPFYMAPEQITSTKDVDARSDIYAAGVIMYEMLTGRVPFSAKTFPALVYAIVNDRPTPVTQHEPRVPPALVRIVERAMARDPAARYPSMEALLEELEGFERNRLTEAPPAHLVETQDQAVRAPSHAPPPTVPLGVPATAPQRADTEHKPQLVLAAVIAAIALLVLAAAYRWLTSDLDAHQVTPALDTAPKQETTAPTQPQADPPAQAPSGKIKLDDF